MLLLTVKLAEPCQARKKLKLVDENSQLDKPYCTLSDDTLGEESQHQETKSPEVPQLMPMKRPLEKSERELMYVEMENLRKERDNALQKYQVWNQ
ncbi:hypothetical protein ACJMK2_000750 [Sinanodonta woodiana]|uniref:Uncharacterized protein n=1 Tax=Sinanodonta woodiana TaxID=1069815 RepID=A0ABD3XTH3_SINWO